MANKRNNRKTEPAQEVQEVQEVTKDTKGPLMSANSAWDLASAELLIKKAARHYGKPIEETTLQDALDMTEESKRSDSKNLSDNDKAEIDRATDSIIKTAAGLFGKEPQNVTLKDIQPITKGKTGFGLSKETFDNMSKHMAAANTFESFVAALTADISNFIQSQEFKTLAEVAKQTAAFLSDIISHRSELAEILNKAEQFTETVLPYIVLELADRTGEKDIQLLSFEQIRDIIDASAAKPEKDLTPFEKELNTVLDNFSFDGKPETEYGAELLIAAAERKLYFDDVLGVTDVLTGLAETMASDAPNTEKAEIIKRDLPARFKSLQEISAVVLDRKPTSLNKPTDRVNNEITQPLIKDKLLKTGQKRFAMVNDGKGHGVPVTLGVSFNLDELKKAGIPATITAYDITMQQAIHTIYKTAYDTGLNIGDHGEVYTTPNQIWAQMGSRNKLKTKSQRDKFVKAFQKCNTTSCNIETNRLLNQYSKDGKSLDKEVNIRAHYSGTLIQAMYAWGIIDGTEREIIVIFSDPILTSFAMDLGQITEIPLYVIQATGTLNEDNLAVANYLQHEIAYMKRQPRNPVINLAELKKKTGTIKRDKVLKEYIEELLTEYTNPPRGEKPFIDGFEKVKTGYKIRLLRTNKKGGSITAKEKP